MSAELRRRINPDTGFPAGFLAIAPRERVAEKIRQDIQRGVAGKGGIPALKSPSQEAVIRTTESLLASSRILQRRVEWLMPRDTRNPDSR